MIKKICLLVCVVLMFIGSASALTLSSKTKCIVILPDEAVVSTLKCNA